MAMTNSKTTAGIPCPSCGCGESAVRRTTRNAGLIVRVRVCCACGRRWATHERSAGSPGISTTDARTYAASLIRALEADPLFHLRKR